MKGSCAHCGTKPAERVWNVRPCAIGKRRQRRLCEACDVKLNDLVLRFFKEPERKALMARYKEGQCAE